MTRRRLLVFGLLAGLLVLGGGVWLLWPRTAINRENFDKIHVGLTEAEVEVILGGPAGNYYSTSADPYGSLFIPSGKRLIGGKEWIGPEAVINVAFDQAGRVNNTQILERSREPTWARVRRWLGL